MPIPLFCTPMTACRSESVPLSKDKKTSFADLGLAESILHAVKREGYDTPTPIQAGSIPAILEGRDVLGCAQTGTGKTAAFALPVLDLLSGSNNGGRRRGERAPRALILSPTRELAEQIADSFKTYGKKTGLHHTLIYGGVSQGKQVRDLMGGTDIIVATPGRLIDLLQQGYVNLEEIELFVLDEADRMLDMGFIHPIRRIADLIPEDHQTLLFSATMPKAIASLADSLLNDPVKVTVNPVASTAPKIEQSLYMVPQERKASLLVHLLEDQYMPRTLVFTRTKHGADKLTKRLNKSGVPADAIHGNKSQNQRRRALDSFRKGKTQVLVATDVAARGIDVDGVSHVINYSLPEEPESYVHRIGRTGRAGATGVAIAFCDKKERKYLKEIHRVTGSDPMLVELPELPAETGGLIEGVERAQARQSRVVEPKGPRGGKKRLARGGKPGESSDAPRGKRGAKPSKARSRKPGTKRSDVAQSSSPGSRRSRAAEAGKKRMPRKSRPAATRKKAKG